MPRYVINQKCFILKKILWLFEKMTDCFLILDSFNDRFLFVCLFVFGHNSKKQRNAGFWSPRDPKSRYNKTASDQIWYNFNTRTIRRTHFINTCYISLRLLVIYFIQSEMMKQVFIWATHTWVLFVAFSVTSFWDDTGWIQPFFLEELMEEN